MSVIYKASIEFRASIDDYVEGQNDTNTSSWYGTLEANTKDELKALILESTHTKLWDDVNDEQMNDYEWCTEYATSYQAINDNQKGLTPPSLYEIDEWKAGREELYSVDCHILVTRSIEEKAVL